MRSSKGTPPQRVLWGIGIVEVILLWGLVAVAQEVGMTQINVTPPTPAPHDVIAITLAGLWPDACVPRDPQVSIVEHDIHIATFNPGEVCAQVLTPWELTVSIGQLSPATYTVRVSHHCPFGCPREIGHDTFTVVSSTVGGLVTGVSPRTVVCQNLTTRQSVTLRDGARAWNCEAAGLVVHEGDKIRQTVTGTRDPKMHGPTCTPATSDPYNCRLDMGQLCLNITRNDYPTEAACLANLCDLYGPANAQAGLSSWCVYNGRAIKGYASAGKYRAGDFCAADTVVPYEELTVYRSDGVATYCEYEGRQCPGSGAPAAWELPLGMTFTGLCP